MQPDQFSPPLEAKSKNVNNKYDKMNSKLSSFFFTASSDTIANNRPVVYQGC